MTPERSVEEIANGILPESAISVAGTEDADLERALAHIKIAFTEALSTERQARVEAEAKAEMLEEPCICSEYDGQGYSTCGAVCPEHYDVIIERLSAKLYKALKVVEAARNIRLNNVDGYYHLVEALHAFDEVDK